MKLSSRERIMLTILVIIAIYGLSYYFIFIPRLDKMDAIKLERENMKQQMDQLKQEIASVDSLEKDFDKMNSEIQEKSKTFLPSIFQSKLIIILNQLSEKSQVQVMAAQFVPPIIVPFEEGSKNVELDFPIKNLVKDYKNDTSKASTDANINGNGDATQATLDSNKSNSEQAAAPATVVEKMSVTFNCSSDYMQMMAFIKGIEALNRTIIINNLDIKMENGLLNSSITLDFYALPKLHDDQDKEYYNWPYNGQYGKINPFMN